MNKILNGYPVEITIYIGVPFDNSYKNVLFRPVNVSDEINGSGNTYNKMDMSNFLDDMKVSSLDTTKKFKSYSVVGEYNFPYINSLNTQVVLEIPNEFVYSNYLRVVSTKPHTANELDYVEYYFITDFTVLNTNETMTTIRFNLECDVFATYGSEFFNAIVNRPLYTERKHCQRYLIGDTIPYCPDIINSDDVLNGCKSSIVKSAKSLALTVNNSYDDIIWCYISYKSADPTISPTLKGIPTICTQICFPMVREFKLVIPNTNAILIHPKEILNQLYDDVKTYYIKFAQYPPFTSLENASFEYNKVIDEYTLTINELLTNTNTNYTFKIGNNVFVGTYSKPEIAFCLMEQNDTEYQYVNITGDININNIPSKPTTNIREKDLKLYFAPITQYYLTQRSSGDFEIHPEFLMNEKPLTYGINVKTYFTATMQDNAYYHFVRASGDNYTMFDNMLNNSFKTSLNYNFPTGEDALKTFNATQSSKYNTSNLLKGITSFLGMIGGAGLTAVNPMFGIATIGGSASGLANAIANPIANKTDLLNTPDKINNTGSSLFGDYSSLIDNDNLQLHYYIKSMSETELKNLDDYFYKYGYNVGRDCRFFTYFKPITTTSSNYVDTRLITRKSFNYVKIKDDIKSKIGGCNIPNIVIDKFNEILNNGVNLLTYYQFHYMGASNNELEWNFKDFEDYWLLDNYENIEIL